MNVTQRKYATDRINSLMGKVKNGLRAKFYTPNKGLTDNQKLQSLKEALGWEDVKLKYKVKMSTPLGEAFDFSKLEPGETFDHEAWLTACEDVEKKAAKVRDEIMLGDEEKAKELINDFMKEFDNAESK